MLYRDFFRLLESKDRLIDKLDLTDEQKEQLKVYFKKYPTSESKIDWNKKDLQWKDFELLLANEGKSKSQAKKKGLSGLKEGRDYILVGEEDGEFGRYTLYYPLNFLASETLANPKVSPLGVTGQWCISGGNYGPDNDDKYWKQYIEDNGYDFIFLFTDKRKFAISRREGWVNGYNWSEFQIFTQNDNEIDRDKLSQAIMMDSGIWTANQSKPAELTRLMKEIWGYLETQYLQDKDLKKHLFHEEKRQCGDTMVAMKTSSDGKTLYKFDIMSKPGDKTILPEEIETIRPGAVIGLDVDLYIQSRHPLTTSNPEDRDDRTEGAFTRFDGVIHSNQASDFLFYNVGYSDRQKIAKVVLSPKIRHIGDMTFCHYRPSDAKYVKTGRLWAGRESEEQAYKFEDLFENGQIPESLARVGYGAFWSSNIYEFPFEKYPYCSYGGYAFCGTNIRKAVIPEGITELPYNMFGWCNSLKEIHLPASLERIGELALFDCHPDLKIYYAGSEESWAQMNIAVSWLGHIRMDEGVPVVFNNPEGKTIRHFKCGQTMPWETLDGEADYYAPYEDNKTGYAGY